MCSVVSTCWRRPDWSGLRTDQGVFGTQHPAHWPHSTGAHYCPHHALPLMLTFTSPLPFHCGHIPFKSLIQCQYKHSEENIFLSSLISTAVNASFTIDSLVSFFKIPPLLLEAGGEGGVKTRKPVETEGNEWRLNPKKVLQVSDAFIRSWKKRHSQAGEYIYSKFKHLNSYRCLG